MSEENALISRPVGDLSAGSLFFNTGKFEHAQRVALALSSSTMVPEHYRGKENLGNVLIALNFAERTMLDPFMVMQNLYVVHGRPGIEAKLAIALVNNTGRFSPLSWRLEGSGKDRKATCHAIRKDTREECAAECSMALAEAEGWVSKSGSKWKTMPDMMLQYRSATFFARLYCPEALLGLQTREELIDVPMQVYGPAEDSLPPRESTTAKLKRAAKSKPETPEEPPAPEAETLPDTPPAVAPDGKLWCAVARQYMLSHLINSTDCNHCQLGPDCPNFPEG